MGRRGGGGGLSLLLVKSNEKKKKREIANRLMWAVRRVSKYRGLTLPGRFHEGVGPALSWGGLAW